MQNIQPLPSGAEPDDQPLSQLQLADRDWERIQTLIIQEGRTFSELVTRHASNDVAVKELEASRGRLHALRALRDSVFEAAFRGRL